MQLGAGPRALQGRAEPEPVGQWRDGGAGHRRGCRMRMTVVSVGERGHQAQRQVGGAVERDVQAAQPLEVGRDERPRPPAVGAHDERVHRGAPDAQALARARRPRVGLAGPGRDVVPDQASGGVTAHGEAGDPRAGLERVAARGPRDPHVGVRERCAQARKDLGADGVAGVAVRHEIHREAHLAVCFARPRARTAKACRDRRRSYVNNERRLTRRHASHMTSWATTTNWPTDLLRVGDLTCISLAELLDLAARMKSEPDGWSKALAGQSLACVLDGPSMRTRLSAEAAAHRLGLVPVALAPEDLELGHPDAIGDVARTLSTYVCAVVARNVAQETLAAFARAASVPVINVHSPGHHPCQALADLLTLRERFGALEGLVLAYG